MAGTVNTGYRNYTRFYIDWSESTQDITNNRTLINWTVGIQAQPGWTPYWGSNAVRINSAYIDGQQVAGSQTFSNLSPSNGGKIGLRSGSVWVGHNSDGTKSISVSVSGWFYGNGDVSASGSWGLATIPRNSQVSTNKSIYTLGEPIQIITNRKSSSFTHTITIRLHNSGGTVIQTINSVGASTTWTPSPAQITQMQNAIPNSNNLSLFINQYNDQVRQNSNVTRTLTLTDANPEFSTFTYRDSNALTASITGDDQVLVKGKSTLETTISSANKMVAVKGANPAHYTVAYDGVTAQTPYSASAAIVNTFNANTIGDRTIIATAFDSRGNNTSVPKLITVYDYQAPSLVTSLTRENNFGSDTTVTISGTYTPLVIGGTAKNSIVSSSLSYRFRVAGGTFGSWVNRTFTATNGVITSPDFVVSLNNQNKYEFEFRVSDKFGEVVFENSVDIGQPIMFVGDNDGIPSIGVGTMPDPGVALQVGDLSIKPDGMIPSSNVDSTNHPTFNTLLFSYSNGAGTTQGGSTSVVNHNGFPLITFTLDRTAMVEFNAQIRWSSQSGSSSYMTLHNGNPATSANEVWRTIIQSPSGVTFGDNGMHSLLYTVELPAGTYDYRVGFFHSGAATVNRTWANRSLTVKVIG